MSTDYRFEKEIKFTDLFDGRLEHFGIHEKIIDGQTSSNYRLLTEGSNGLWVWGNEVVGTITRCGLNNPANILNAITDTFDTRLISEFDPQFWGFETDDEWEYARDEYGKEGRGETYIEIMNFVSDKTNDIKPGTTCMAQANIAKSLIAGNPILASPDQESTLMELIDREYMENPSARIALNEDDIVLVKKSTAH